MKYILMLLIFINIAGAQKLILNEPKQSNEQKQLTTLKDYYEYINTMKKTISYGDYSAAMYLGALYAQDINLKDGIKKAKPSVAKKYFRFAFNKGYGFAAFYLSKYENANQALLDLRKALYMKHTTQKVRELLAIRYAEIILNDDELCKNKRAIEIAITDINQISKNSNNPILDFQIAHLYYADKQIDKANKYINSACNNPKATMQLLALCLSDPYLTKKGENEKTMARKKLPNLSDQMYNNSDFNIKNRSK